MNKAIAHYKHWKNKHRRSVGVYIFINMLIFIMLASTAVLNLWALKYGTSQILVKAMFIVMAVMSSFGSFVSGIMSFFNFKKRIQSANDKISAIENHFQMYKDKKPGLYENANRDNNLLQNITDILNKD